MPAWTPEEARKYASKGGKASPVSKSVRKRRYCAQRCPISSTCWARPLAISNHKNRMAKGDKNSRPACELNNMPETIINRTLKVVADGEQGFAQAIISTLLEYANMVDLEPTPTNMRKLLHEMRETHRTVYGSRNRVTAEVETTQKVITADDLAKAFEDSETSQEEK